MSRRQVIVSLLLPILFVMGFHTFHHYTLSSGTPYVLEVYAVEPTDFSSSSYLKYGIDYRTPSICPEGSHSSLTKMIGYLCLQPRSFSYEQPSNCPLYVKGQCHAGRFISGIEQIYVPTKLRPTIFQMTHQRQVKVSILVNGSGHALVNHLLIDGQNWLNFHANKK